MVGEGGDAKMPRGLAEALSGLSEREREVVLERYRYGLLTGQLRQCQRLSEGERARLERLMEDRYGIGKR